MSDRKQTAGNEKAGKLFVSPSAMHKAIVPPVLQEVGRLAASVASVNTTTSTGSATGNPRNKCALQPGHSLMDWIRLGASGKDLTGVGPLAGRLPVSPEELSKHDQRGDAWISIRGNVYSITDYLNFHPGGVDPILMESGKDATEAFDEIHPWVNYSQILSKCLIGPLERSAPNIEMNSIKKSIEITDEPTTVKPEVTNITSVNHDWIQKSDKITLTFYTGALNNPFVEVLPPMKGSIHIIITMKHAVFDFFVKLYKDVQWPPELSVNYDTGKVDVVFEKVNKEIWKELGKVDKTVKESHFAMAVPTGKGYHLVTKKKINFNCYILEFARTDGAVHNTPLARHVKIYNNMDQCRSYSPIPSCTASKLSPSFEQMPNLFLLVKVYPNGNLSKFICSKNEHEYISASKPVGLFDLKMIAKKENFLFIAGGTGVTPMLNLILFILGRRSIICQKVSLLFFNSTEDDLILRRELQLLQKEDSRFSVDFILTKPSSNWIGTKGSLSEEIVLPELLKILNGTDGTEIKDVYFGVCGPTGFVSKGQKILQGANVLDNQMYLFPG